MSIYTLQVGLILCLCIHKTKSFNEFMQSTLNLWGIKKTSLEHDNKLPSQLLELSEPNHYVGQFSKLKY